MKNIKSEREGEKFNGVISNSTCSFSETDSQMKNSRNIWSTLINHGFGHDFAYSSLLISSLVVFVCF